MQDSRAFLKKSSFNSILLALCLAAAISFSLSQAVNHTLRWQVNLTLLRYAEHTSNTWAKKFFDITPRAATMIATGQTVDEERVMLNKLSFMSDVFRFQFYDMQGQMTYDSKGVIPTLEDMQPDERALSVLNGENCCNAQVLKTGTPATGTVPLLFIEVFIPAVNANEEKIGLIRTNVDVTQLKKNLDAAFARMSDYTILGMTVLLLLPTLAFIYRSWQVARKNKELEELAHYDQLTGAFNRRTAAEILDDFFNRPMRSHQLGLMFIDVDHFKQVNDQYGHESGDQILKHVANCLDLSIRDKLDIVARYGGDEFLIICPNADLRVLREVHRRVLRELRYVFSRGEDLPLPTLSIGGYVTRHGDSQRDALHRADAALYSAKRNGRNQFVEYHPDLDHIFEGNSDPLPDFPSISLAAR